MAKINEVKLFLSRSKNVDAFIKSCGLTFIQKLNDQLSSAKEILELEQLEQEEKEKEKENKLNQAREYINSLGLKPEELIINRRKANIKYKYKNENGKTFTWTGVGRKPKWVVEIENKNESLEKYAI